MPCICIIICKHLILCLSPTSSKYSRVLDASHIAMIKCHHLLIFQMTSIITSFSWISSPSCCEGINVGIYPQSHSCHLGAPPRGTKLRSYTWTGKPKYWKSFLRRQNAWFLEAALISVLFWRIKWASCQILACILQVPHKSLKICTGLLSTLPLEGGD